MNRERIVSNAPALGVGQVRADRAQDLVPVEQRLDRLARRPKDLEAEGVERPDPDARRQVRAERRQRGLDPLPELLGGAPVERDRADRLGRGALVDQPRDPGDERRRLAGSRGRDAQHRPGRRRRGASLVDLEPREALDDRRMLGHVAECARIALTVRGQLRCAGAPRNRRCP